MNQVITENEKFEGKLIVYELHLLGFLANLVTAKNDATFAESTLKGVFAHNQFVDHIISDEVCEDTYIPLIVLLYNSIIRVK
jgi:hypothetical protein